MEIDRFEEMCFKATDLRLRYGDETTSGFFTDELLLNTLDLLFDDSGRRYYLLSRFIDPSLDCCACSNTMNKCKKCVAWAEYIDNFKTSSEIILLFTMDTMFDKLWNLEEEEWVPRSMAYA